MNRSALALLVGYLGVYPIGLPAFLALRSSSRIGPGSAAALGFAVGMRP